LFYSLRVRRVSLVTTETVEFAGFGDFEVGGLDAGGTGGRDGGDVVVVRDCGGGEIYGGERGREVEDCDGVDAE
jgi:hypothetical protein